MDDRSICPISVVATAVTAAFSIPRNEGNDSLVCELSQPSRVPSALRRRGTSHTLARNADGLFVVGGLQPATIYSVRACYGTDWYDLSFTTQARLAGPQLVPHCSCATTLCVRWMEPTHMPSPKYSIRHRRVERKYFGEVPWETKILSRDDLLARNIEATMPVSGSGLLQTPNSVISGWSPSSVLSFPASAVSAEPADDLDRDTKSDKRSKINEDNEEIPEADVVSSDKAENVQLLSLARKPRTHGLANTYTTWPLSTGFTMSAPSAVHTSYTFEGLQPRLLYQIELAVHDANDDAIGPWSETLEMETSRAAPSAINLIVAGVTHREVALTWMTDEMETDDAILEFIVHAHGMTHDKRDWKTNIWLEESRAEGRKRSLRPNLNCCVLDIQPNSTYSMEVVAVTKVGTSEKPVKAVVTSMSLAPLPSLRVDSFLHDAVNLAWQYPSDIKNFDYHLVSTREQHIVKVRFRIGRMTIGFFSSRDCKEEEWIVENNGTGVDANAEPSREYFPMSYQLKGLDPEAAYNFQVKVFTCVGESDWSVATPVIVTRSVAPTLVTIVTLVKAIRQALLIKWSPSSSTDVTSYMLRYKRSKQADWEHYREIATYASAMDTNEPEQREVCTDNVTLNAWDEGREEESESGQSGTEANTLIEGRADQSGSGQSGTGANTLIKGREDQSECRQGRTDADAIRDKSEKHSESGQGRTKDAIGDESEKHSESGQGRTKDAIGDESEKHGASGEILLDAIQESSKSGSKANDSRTKDRNEVSENQHERSQASHESDPKARGYARKVTFSDTQAGTDEIHAAEPTIFQTTDFSTVPKPIPLWVLANVDNLESFCGYDFEVAAKTRHGIGKYTKSVTICTIGVAPDVVGIDLVETRPTVLQLRLSFPMEPDVPEITDLAPHHAKFIATGVNDDVTSVRVRISTAESAGYLKSFSFRGSERKNVWDDREVPFNPITQECEIDSLVPSKLYHIQAAAQTPAGCGLMSAEVRFSTWKACVDVHQPKVLWNSYNRCQILLQPKVETDARVKYRNDALIGFEVCRSKMGKEISYRFDAESDYRADIGELEPSTEYEIKARSFSETGAGLWSEPMQFMTLPVAPPVIEVKMLYANADSLDISWETAPLLATLGESDDEDPLSADLNVVGYDLRWVDDATAVFKRPYCNPVRVDHVGDEPFFRIENLKAAQVYMVQVRSVTSVGESKWSAEYPFQTTVPAPPPSQPMLIMSTATQLTISFEVFVDEFDVFQVQLAEKDRLSEPLTIAPDTVRCNGGHRVVTLQDLRPDALYRARIRGVTRKKTSSSWSEKSAPMRTRQGVVDHTLTIATEIFTEAKDDPQLRLEEESLGKKLQETIEPSLKFLLKVVLGGVEFPQDRGNYPSVKEQAHILLLTYGTAEAAIDFCVKEAENSGNDSLHLLSGNVADFVIGCIPIAGFPAVFLKELGAKLRRCALIAELSGHDTENIDVLMLMFTCMVPKIGGSAAVAEETAQSLDVNALVRGVTRAVVAETLVLAAGIPTLRHVVHKGMELLLGSGEEAPVTSVESLATEVFRATPANEEVWFLALCGALWALPFILSALNFFFMRISPYLESKLSHGISLYVVLLSLFVGWITAAPIIFKYQDALRLLTRSDSIVDVIKIPAPIIFIVHAGLPCLSCFLAMRDVAIGFSAVEHQPMILAGVYSMVLNYIRWCLELKGRAQLDESEVPIYGTYHPQARIVADLLWRCGLFFFFVEEFLGRLIGLHDIRLISGAASMLNFKTIQFAFSLVGARSQAHLLDSLQKRQVLLRVLGAKRTVTGSMIILLTGVLAMAKYRETEKFFARISPNPMLCCAVVMIRRWGIVVGILLPTIWLLFHLFPAPLDFVFTLTSGCALGSVVASMSIAEWSTNENSYRGNFRVIFLFPETSAKLRDAYEKLLLTGTDVTVRKGAIVGSQAIIRGMWGFMAARFRR